MNMERALRHIPKEKVSHRAPVINYAIYRNNE